MKRSVVAMVLVLSAMCASTAAAQAPTQDSVSGQGGGGFGGGSFSFRIDAHSGPGGEAPSGTASLKPVLFNDPFTGPVTCLTVNGNTATLNFVVTNSSNPADPYVFTYSVIDSPAGDQLTYSFDTRSPSDCSPPTSFVSPVSGDIVVVDAQPPTTYLQCRQAGWAKYGFESHAACNAYVHDLARRKCIFERAANGIVAFRAKYGLGPDQDYAMRHCVRLYTGF